MYSSNFTFGQYNQGSRYTNQNENEYAYNHQPNHPNLNMSTNLNENGSDPYKHDNMNMNEANFNRNNPERIAKKDSRRTFSNGEYEFECPDGFENESITGEVIIRHLKTKKIVYSGQLFNSEKYGFGIENDDDGNFRYEGEFRADKREGWGKTEEYMGQFKDDMYDGWGKLATPEVLYEGYFSEGKYNGIGIFVQATGSFTALETLKNQKKIEEYLLDQISKNKNFFEEFSIDEIYIGQWTKGLKNGSGKLWKSDGSWYTGQFAYDNPYGFGTYFERETGNIRTGLENKGMIKKKESS